MKRYPVFALAALLFLLLVLLGAWVYLKNYQWPGGDETSMGVATQPDGNKPDRSVIPDEDTIRGDGNADGDDADSTRPEPEPGRDATGPSPPPDPVKTGPKRQSKPDPEEGRETIVAELKLTDAGVRVDGDSEKGLEPLIISTLPAAMYRESAGTQFEALLRGVPGKEDTGIRSLSRDAPEPSRFLQGRLLWPEMPPKQRAQLQGNKRFQAVVYIEKLPEFRAVVHEESGLFTLPVTKRLAEDYGRKGLPLVVHSPLFEISGGFEAVLVKKDDGPIRIQLQVAPVLEVTVDVAPAEAVAAGVRVWLERRGLPGTPDFDDSLYMSARVPDTGRLIFMVPEHYGEIRVGATGELWHSGMAQTVKLRSWKTNGIRVLLPLVAERCDLVSGNALSKDGSALKGARFESTHFGTTVYSDSAGAFQMYLPFDSMKTARQFIASRHGFRPEVVPLESAGTATAGVEGSAPWGPYQVTMTDKVEVQLDLRGVVEWNGSEIGNQFENSQEVPGIGMRGRKVLRWGTTLVVVENMRNPEQKVAVWIDPAEWDKAFQAYAAGDSEVAELTTESWEKAFRRR